jgi:4-aminobutyrate aminotransferase-like enzyme
MDAWPASTGEALHTSTFLGNPVGCAMALAALQLHGDPALPKQVRERGAKLKARLQEIDSPRIGDVRGVGLMLGVELVLPDGKPDGAGAIALVQQGLQDGLIFLADSPTSNVLSFTPAFGISDAEIAFVAGWLGKQLAERRES